MCTCSGVCAMFTELHVKHSMCCNHNIYMVAKTFFPYIKHNSSNYEKNIKYFWWKFARQPSKSKSGSKGLFSHYLDLSRNCSEIRCLSNYVCWLCIPVNLEKKKKTESTEHKEIQRAINCKIVNSAYKQWTHRHKLSFIWPWKIHCQGPFSHQTPIVVVCDILVNFWQLFLKDIANTVLLIPVQTNSEELVNLRKNSYNAKNYRNLANVWITTTQRSGFWASWEAFYLLTAHFVGCFGYLAVDTLFWAKIDAPVREHYHLP